MRFHKLVVLSIILSIRFHSELCAQISDYVFQQYTKSDGLPTNTIYGVAVDKNGVLWFATDAGVIKFVNGRFRLFTTADGLPSNEVFALYCDSKNRIWVTSIKDKITFIEKDKIISEKNEAFLKDLETGVSIPYFSEDIHGRIWVHSSNKNTFKYLDKYNNVKKLSYTNPISDKGYIFYAQIKDTIIFGGPHCLLALKNDKVPHLIGIVPNSLRNKPFQDLFTINESLWGLNMDDKFEQVRLSEFIKSTYYIQGGGIEVKNIFEYLIYPKGDKFFFIPLSKLEDKKVLLHGIQPGTSCTGLNNSIWVSTLGQGLFSFKNLDAKLVTNQLRPSSRNITSVSYNNQYIICGNSVGEVYAMDKKDLKFKNSISLISSSDLTSRVISITTSKSTTFLAHTSNKLVKLNAQGKDIEESSQVAIKKIYSNDLQVLMCQLGGFCIMNSDSIWNTQPNGEPMKRIYSYTTYKNKKIFGTQDSLLFWNKPYPIPINKFHLTSELAPYPLKQNFDYRALDLNVYNDSLLIATTAEKGIFFIKDSNIITNINTSNGLSTNSCNRSIIYKDALYTATSKGIHIYHFKSKEMYHAFESDGLPSNTVNDIAINNDTIYAATEAGLCILPISSIKKDKTFPFFVDPIIVHMDTLWDKPKHLNARTDYDIRFSMNALSYTSKSPITFYYRIKELDSNYTQTADADVSLRLSKPGNYTLECFAVNGENTRSALSTISIHVKPYFYQTILFILLLSILALLALVWLYKFLTSRARLKAEQQSEIENKIRNLELTAWKSNINPHFLFNSLNTMQGLFVKGDLRTVNNYIAEFSTMLRKTIDQSSRLLITVDEEMLYLKSYLELERIKRYNKVQYNLESDSDIKNYYIPSLLIQPIIENSLKHAIKDKDHGTILIRFTRENNTIKCLIEDNGPGYPRLYLDKPNSKGLRLIKSKIDIIEKITKQIIIFTFGNNTDTNGTILGAQTVFIFPLLTSDYDTTNSNTH